MNRQDAERIITEYMKPIFSFTLSRCRNIQDAEDLSQEIVMKAFRAMLIKDDIADIGKFIWTVAHNALSNYYRDSVKCFMTVPIDELEYCISDPDAELGMDDLSENIERMKSEIAYLSKLQRRIIIAYYYENRKQSDIAAELGIPVGTVKWNLFEAKKELKRGMEKSRDAGELKFNPISFWGCSTNGSVGFKGHNQNFFHSALSQNIVYVVWKEAKTVNEIADILGVSPVYVESEADYLEEYGFLTKKGGKYLCNMLIKESNEELSRACYEMYTKLAKIFANELYDALICSDILDSSDLWGGRDNSNMTFQKDPPKDRNFILWALIPYIAALSGEKQFEEDEKVTFEEAATIRPDGAQNICSASIRMSGEALPESDICNWFGPSCGNYKNELGIWKYDSEWSGIRKKEDLSYDMNLLTHFLNDDELLTEEYAYLAEHGYITVCGEPDGMFKTAMQCVCLSKSELRGKLLEIGDKIKAAHRDEFNSIKEAYIEAVMAKTPEHLKKMQLFELQYILYSDGKFIMNCLLELVNNGKLKPPAEEQKKSLTIVVTLNR